MTIPKSLPSKEYFENFVYLDEQSPSGLSWKFSNYSGKHKSVPSRKAGTPAGGLNSTGYYSINLDYKSYLAHRVIMILCGENIDNKCVDHIDGNTKNNAINNLRLVSYRQNSQNRKLSTNNESGVVGVYRCELPNNSNGSTNEYWVARWVENETKRHKYFSIKKLGEDYAKESAIRFRMSKIVELNSNGQNYTSRHMEPQ